MLAEQDAATLHHNNRTARPTRFALTSRADPRRAHDDAHRTEPFPSPLVLGKPILHSPSLIPLQLNDDSFTDNSSSPIDDVYEYDPEENTCELNSPPTPSSLSPIADDLSAATAKPRLQVDAWCTVSGKTVLEDFVRLSQAGRTGYYPCMTNDESGLIVRHHWKANIPVVRMQDDRLIRGTALFTLDCETADTIPSIPLTEDGSPMRTDLVAADVLQHVGSSAFGRALNIDQVFLSDEGRRLAQPLDDPGYFSKMLEVNGLLTWCTLRAQEVFEDDDIGSALDGRSEDGHCDLVQEIVPSPFHE